MQSHNHTRLFLVQFLATLTGLIIAGAIGGLAGHYAGYFEGYRAALTATPIEAKLTEAVQKVSPAVVTIINQQDPRAGPAGLVLLSVETGSGVIFDSRGYILTNNHVVARAERLFVIFSDGTKTEGTMVGADSLSDLAVIKVNGQVPLAVPLADSSKLELGQMLIAIGSPYEGFRGTVTVGVVSGLDRQVGGLKGMIQTDAPINVGNSGGPLITTKGEVIGINTLVLRSNGEGRILEGMGFAISSNQARDILSQLINKGLGRYP